MRTGLFDPWTWKMMWRETRASRRRLLLFTLSIVFGVAALVAIHSFARNLEEAVNDQAKVLLGADLVISSRRSYDEDQRALIDSLGGEQSSEVRFNSMVYLPRPKGTRLAEIRALEGDFPFYGVLETSPAEAAQTFRRGPFALVDDGLMLQFNAQAGDSIKIGAFTFEIAGRIKNIPGEALAASLIEPRIYIPRSYLEETGLIQTGSRVSYRTYFRFPPGTDVEKLEDDIEPRLTESHLRSQTVADRQARLGRSMDNLYAYLHLGAFVALLLGGIGVASAVHLYLRQKLANIAILRCLGAQSKQAFSIYVLQAVSMGLVGTAIGILVGIAVLGLVPFVLSDFLPLEVSTSISGLAVLQGAVLGFIVSLLFALLPLSAVRHISPLTALRLPFEGSVRLPRDPVRWLIVMLIVVITFALALAQSRDWEQGIFFAGAVLVAFLLLAAVARILTVSVRRFFPGTWSYPWRQGLANLYRPNNQTLVMIVSLGLGTFLIATLFLVRSTLLHQVTLASSEGKPNMVLFDIQTDQKPQVLEHLRSFQLPLIQDVPIVTMRVASINGRTAEEIAGEPESRAENWALFREYRCTYRDHLVDSETLLRGTFQGLIEDPSEPVPISVYQGILEDLHVALGDRLVFDVQGVPVETVVSSVRDVDWRRLQPNFFVVFPLGILEEAPQFHVLVTRTDSTAQSAELQRRVVTQFPNVSIIDLELVFNTVDAVLARVSFAIRFMALFSIITGIIVLLGMVISTRHQRLRESVLLRTLGASRKQVTRIMAIEYLFLGALAALTGLILSIGASWAFARFIFEVDFVLEFPPLAITGVAVVGLTLLIGALANRGLSSRPPLEVLRMEAE